MWIQDPIGNSFLAVNDAFVKLLGYNREEIVGLAVQNLTIKESNLTNDSIKNLAFKAKNGDLIHLELSAFDFSYQGSDARMFTASVQSVESKSAIENSQLFVQEYDSALKAFFNNSGSILVLFNKNLEITAFNSKAQIYAKSLFKTEFVIGKNVVEILPAPFQETFRKLALQALYGNETNNREVKIPNTELWWSLKYFPLYTSNGKIFGASFTALDISERKNQKNF